MMPLLGLPSSLVNSLIQNPFNFISLVLITNTDYLFSILPVDSNSLLQLMPIFLSILSGVIVGFSLGLIGGGGSVLAIPLLVYVIGIDTHVAIGTSALAVASNALINLFYRIGKGCIKIKGGILFAIPGALGTLLGAQLGLATPSENLLVLFALVSIFAPGNTS